MERYSLMSAVSSLKEMYPSLQVLIVWEDAFPRLLFLLLFPRTAALVSRLLHTHSITVDEGVVVTIKERNKIRVRLEIDQPTRQITSFHAHLR